MSYATYKEIGVDKNNSQEVVDYQVPIIQTLVERIEKIKQYPVVVVYYYTDWCGPCKMVAPKFAKLAQNYLQKGILLVKENAENNLGSYPENIRGVPCFHFYLNGQYLSEHKVTGAGIEQVDENIKKLFNY